MLLISQVQEPGRKRPRRRGDGQPLPGLQGTVDVVIYDPANAARHGQDARATTRCDCGIQKLGAIWRDLVRSTAMVREQETANARRDWGSIPPGSR